MNWTPYGRHAMMVYFADKPGEEAFQISRNLMATLRESTPHGLIEFTPGFTSLLLEFDPAQVLDVRTVAQGVMELLGGAGAMAPPAGRLVEIPVVYQGPDLKRVAAHNRISVREVIQRHSAPEYRVCLLGFAPGFPYLGGLDPTLRTPRLPSPRPSVLAGSVAIGGEHTGIYPFSTPGGWNIIGTTSTRLFEPEKCQDEVSAEQAFLLAPGDRVKFRALNE